VPGQSAYNKPFTIAVYLFRVLVIVVFLLQAGNGNGQEIIGENLKKQILLARSDSERVLLMGELSRYYYATKDFQAADSVFERQIMLAESTLKEHLVLKAYFENNSFLVSSAKTKDRTKIITGFVKRALDYAKANGRMDFVALGYAHLSAINVADGKMVEAFKNADQANTTSLNTENDSVKVATSIQLGKVHQERSDVVKAFQVFTNAQNIAIKSGNEKLLPAVYHAMANLYKKLGKEEEAKKYINRSLQINKAYKDIPGQVNDYIFLAKLSNYTAGKIHLEEALKLADSLNSEPLKIEAETILFSHMVLAEQPSVMFKFLEERTELANTYLRTGPSYLDWKKAIIYLYANQPDSALPYFQRAEQAFNTGYDLTIRKGFFTEYALCVQTLNNIPAAIKYYEKSLEFSRSSQDLRASKANAGELKKLYEQQGDYQHAYQFGLLYDQYRDSVDQLGKERDLALLEIDNVKQQQQREEDLARQKLHRKYNLQYMMITVAVIIVFILLIVVGMFKVSAFTIRAMGFLSLIFLFEFIILILDNWIHHITHGEPLKVLLIKIGIISIILPVHHYLEHKLIRYLLSRHLITVRGRLAEFSFFRKKKTKSPPVDVIQNLKEEIQKDQSQTVGGGQIVPNSK